MAEKLSTIVLKVDLHCSKCYNKIRRILCKFHCRIQTQTYDEKQNTVTVTGWFNPECFAKTLRCKAGKTIQDIIIIKEKPKPDKEVVEKPKPDKGVAEKPKADTEVAETKTEKPPPAPAPPPAKPEPVVVPVWVEPTPKFAEPYPLPYPVPYPVPTYWWEPYYEGYGRQPPPPPPPPCDDYYGRLPCHCGCGGNRRCVVVCDYDENPNTSCSIM